MGGGGIRAFKITCVYKGLQKDADVPRARCMFRKDLRREIRKYFERISGTE